MDRKSTTKRLQANLNDWKFLKTIGVGLFGQVKLVKHKKDKIYRAVKIMKKRQIIEMEQVDHIYSEINLLSQLDHPFIVKLLICRRILKASHRTHVLFIFFLNLFQEVRFSRN